MKRPLLRPILFASFFAMFFALFQTASGTDLYLSPNGDDAWSGKLAEPNAAKNDGPLLSLAGAQNAWRKLIRDEKPAEINVFLSDGSWFVPETLQIEAIDRETPLTIKAGPNASPILLGSRSVGKLRFDSGRKGIGTIEVKLGDGDSIPLSVYRDGKRLVKARQPNFDPESPYRKGFYYVYRGVTQGLPFSGGVGNIHNPGDTIEYEIDVKTAGRYRVWLFYGANNEMYGVKNLDGRMTVQVGGGEAVPLTDLPNTGSWSASRWSMAAEIELPVGKTSFVWKNNKGGGIDIGAFVLANDFAWNPTASHSFDAVDEKKFILLSADSFVKSNAKQLQCSSAGGKNAFGFQPGDLNASWATPETELKIFQSGDCRAYQEITTPEKIDETSHIVTLTGRECLSKLNRGDRYYLENHPDFLDTPGEWFFDKKTNLLSVVAEESDAAEYRIAVTETILRVGAGKSRFVLSGVTFAETAFTRDEGCVGYSMGKNGVVELTKTSDATIENCRFFDIGRYAVSVSGGKNNAVKNCEIRRSAQGGVLLQDAKKIRVENNVITDLGLEYKHIGGVVLEGAGTSENLIAGNRIARSSRYGISLKNVGNKNIIDGNDVFQTSLETYDTGAIEVTQQDKNFQSESVIRDNLVRDTGGWSCSGEQDVYLSWGIYLDSFAGGYLVENNRVFDSQDGGFMLQGGKGNRVVNNIFVGGKKYQGYMANYLKNGERLVFENNIICYNNPEAKFFALGSGLTPEILSADRNLYWFAGEPTLDQRPEWKAWRERGFDGHGQIADPLFADPAKQDGTLRHDSPAFQLGFKPIAVKPGELEEP